MKAEDMQGCGVCASLCHAVTRPHVSLQVLEETEMSVRSAIITAVLVLGSAAQAHDFSPDIAKYQQVAATKKLDSKEAIRARLALERAQGQMDQADVKMLLRIRSLTNAGACVNWASSRRSSPVNTSALKLPWPTPRPTTLPRSCQGPRNLRAAQSRKAGL